MLILSIILLVLAGAVCIAFLFSLLKTKTNIKLALLAAGALLLGIFAGYNIFIYDRTPPVLSTVSATIEYGESLTLNDLVEEASDNRSEVTLAIVDISPSDAEISEDSESITISTPGTYEVTISATDEQGNETLEPTVVYVSDLTPPEFTVIPDSYETGYGEVITLSEDSLCVEAEDEVSEVTLSIENVTSENGNPRDEDYTIGASGTTLYINTVGEYLVTVKAEDEYGNSVTTSIPVISLDQTAPTFSGIQSSYVLAETDTEPDYLEGVTAEDEIDGDLTERITLDALNVSYGVPGEYTVTYSVADDAGNVVTKSVEVVIKDTTPPVITLAQSSFSITVGDDAPDYSSYVTVVDAVDGDLTSSVVIDDSAVDYDTAGTYEITYTAKDSSGNSVQQSASVTVKSKVEETTAASTESSGSSSSGTVYITKTGSKYHRSSCRYLSQSKIAISKSEAIAQGYEACKVCKP